MRLDDSGGDDAVYLIFGADIFNVSVLHNAVSFEVRQIIVLLNSIFQKFVYEFLNACNFT